MYDSVLFINTRSRAVVHGIPKLTTELDLLHPHYHLMMSSRVAPLILPSVGTTQIDHHPQAELSPSRGVARQSCRPIKTHLTTARPVQRVPPLPKVVHCLPASEELFNHEENEDDQAPPPPETSTTNGTHRLPTFASESPTLGVYKAKQNGLNFAPRTSFINDQGTNLRTKRKTSQVANSTTKLPIVTFKSINPVLVDKLVTSNLTSIQIKPRSKPLKMRYITRSNDQAITKGVVITPPRPVRLKNYAGSQMSVDTLFRQAKPLMACSDKMCAGSLMRQTRMDYVATLPSLKTKKMEGKCPIVSGELKNPYRTKEEILTDAYQFFELYYDSIKRLNTTDHQNRLGQIKYEVRTTGTYNLSEDELLFGAKLAWRNASRCIGRIQWSKLQFFDARNIKTAREMFERICNHIRCATNNGNIKSTITIFPQRVVGRKDFRLWNPQLVAYAGYESKDTVMTDDSSSENATSKCPIVGDSSNLEFTRICEKLGWKGKGTQFDVLPIIVNVPGQDPEWFEIPEDLILRVKLEHPNFDWFKELNLQWYALPAVSSMKFDVGGIEFPAAPFSGWYMSTEIAVRDLCDIHRYNLLPVVADRIHLDTASNSTLWKDRAVLEVNTAVLHSFQAAKVTIVDHYTAADSFMVHLENENRLRGGCPADWVWIVPPVSGSLTPVYHQEMINYELKPAYLYQKAAWKVHAWKKINPLLTGGRTRNYTLRQVAHSVRFTTNLFKQALVKRVKATILFATETGKSEIFARRLGQIFSHAFNVSVACMDNYDILKLEQESLLLVVTSTFGNGDSPDNGKPFLKQIQAIAKVTTTPVSPREGTSSFSFNLSTGQSSLLKKIRFGVFALGSRAYPQFCAFGRLLDELLGELGGMRFTKLGTGDELGGQDQSFSEWTTRTFEAACQSFELANKVDIEGVLKNLRRKEAKWSRADVKLEAMNMDFDASVEKFRIKETLARNSNKKIVRYKLMEREHLTTGEAKTIRIALQTDLRQASNVNDNWDKADAFYQPGDHLAIYAENDIVLVNALIERLMVDSNNTSNQKYVVQFRSNTEDITKWSINERMPSPISLREALQRYLDITTPPSQKLLDLLADFATSKKEQTELKQLAIDATLYDTWKAQIYPNLLDVLKEFSSVRPPLELIFTQLPALQPRYYSISSSPLANSTIRIDLTVAVVQYRNAAGVQHEGVCSSFFNKVDLGQNIYGFIRSAPAFHMPKETSVPVIMIGPGTGIAPFRGFWQHRKMLASIKSVTSASSSGKMKLLVGCRSPAMQLYKDEIEEALKVGVLSKYLVAFSRKQGEPKKYVQQIMAKHSKQIYEDLICQSGHIFICGDVTMAEDVKKTLQAILEENGEPDGEAAIETLKEKQRYHEDIFGVVLRTTERIKC